MGRKRCCQSDPYFILGYGYCKDQMDRTHALMESLGIPHRFANDQAREPKWQSGWMPQAAAFLLSDQRPDGN